KVKMTTFIQSLDYNLWDIIVFGLELPKQTKYNEKEKEMIKLNAKAKHIIFCDLSSNEFHRISTCNLAKELWDRLADFYGENSCLMVLEGSENESDEEDASKGGNEVSYDEFIEIVEKYASIISSLKKMISCLIVENNELKMTNSSMLINEDKSKDIKIHLLEKNNNCLRIEVDDLKKNIFFLSKENESLRNELDILNMSLELSTNFKEENEKLQIEIDALNKMFSKFSSSSDKLDKIVSCKYCDKVGHASSNCWHRKYSIQVKKVWVPKGTFLTNLKRPKVTWVPKKSI
ncbi:hypothetical protein CFOL_v3_08478, partial [Cephalotus follicularis]